MIDVCSKHQLIIREPAETCLPFRLESVLAGHVLTAQRRSETFFQNYQSRNLYAAIKSNLSGTTKY